MNKVNVLDNTAATLFGVENYQKISTELRPRKPVFPVILNHFQPNRYQAFELKTGGSTSGVPDFIQSVILDYHDLAQVTLSFNQDLAKHSLPNEGAVIQFDFDKPIAGLSTLDEGQEKRQVHVKSTLNVWINLKKYIRVEKLDRGLLITQNPAALEHRSFDELLCHASYADFMVELNQIIDAYLSHEKDNGDLWEVTVNWLMKMHFKVLFDLRDAGLMKLSEGGLESSFDLDTMRKLVEQNSSKIEFDQWYLDYIKDLTSSEFPAVSDEQQRFNQRHGFVTMQAIKILRIFKNHMLFKVLDYKNMVYSLGEQDDQVSIKALQLTYIDDVGPEVRELIQVILKDAGFQQDLRKAIILNSRLSAA